MEGENRTGNSRWNRFDKKPSISLFQTDQAPRNHVKASKANKNPNPKTTLFYHGINMLKLLLI